ncbi:MAG: DUF4097 family beta strand repeat-containing protein [Lachnospiraceae bacterium]|nr:DUF4097 family beta strand repeat-containing protein [Lachnospiraceae bacterium]
MGKWTKRILIIAVIMIAAGFIMIQAGRIAGGTEYLKGVNLDYLDKKHKKVKKVIKKEELDTFENVEIDFHDFDLKILPSEDEKFYLSYSYDGDKSVLSYKIKDKTLYMKESNGSLAKRNVWIHIDDLKYGLIPIFSGDIEYEMNIAYLYIPKNVNLKQLNVDIDDGDFILKNVKAQAVDILGDDGDILLKDTQITNTRIKEKDGDIILNMSDACLEGLDLELYSKDGDVVVDDVEGSYTMNEDEEEQRFTRKSDTGSKILNAETKDGDIVLKKTN